MKFIPHHYKLLVSNAHKCALIAAKELTVVLLSPHNHARPLNIVGDAQHAALKRLALVFANMYAHCTQQRLPYMLTVSLPPMPPFEKLIPTQLSPRVQTVHTLSASPLMPPLLHAQGQQVIITPYAPLARLYTHIYTRRMPSNQKYFPCLTLSHQLQ